MAFLSRLSPRGRRRVSFIEIVASVLLIFLPSGEIGRLLPARYDQDGLCRRNTGRWAISKMWLRPLFGTKYRSTAVQAWLTRYPNLGSAPQIWVRASRRGIEIVV
jgi:hypothetical protein